MKSIMKYSVILLLLMVALPLVVLVGSSSVTAIVAPTLTPTPTPTRHADEFYDTNLRSVLSIHLRCAYLPRSRSDRRIFDQHQPRLSRSASGILN